MPDAASSTTWSRPIRRRAPSWSFPFRQPLAGSFVNERENVGPRHSCVFDGVLSTVDANAMRLVQALCAHDRSGHVFGGTILYTSPRAATIARFLYSPGSHERTFCTTRPPLQFQKDAGGILDQLLHGHEETHGFAPVR